MLSIFLLQKVETPINLNRFADAVFMRVFDDALVMESNHARGNITLADWFNYRNMEAGRLPWTLAVFVDKQN